MYYINPHDLEYVQWEPTSYCNANCIGCPRTDNETMLTKPYIVKFQRHASAEQVQYFIDSIVDERLVNLKTLQYNGNIGDAMMHPNIDDILISISRRRPSIHQIVHTNGGGPWAKKFAKVGEYISKENLDANIAFTFSIDGLEDTNDMYRKNVQWKHIITNSEVLRKHNVNVKWRMIKFNHNAHQIAEAEKIAKSWGWEFEVNEDTFGQELVDIYKDNKADTSLYKEKIKNFDLEFEDMFYEYPKSNNKFTDSCYWQKHKSIQVVSDMTVWPCCWTSHFHFYYGQDNEKIWNKENVTIKDLLNPKIPMLKQWEELFNVGNKNYYENPDIRINHDNLLYNVLIGKTFTSIGKKLKHNNEFNLDICKNYCRHYHNR
tara:strand:- start:32 stop:1153 length:1122 start_codon:yes stop_codon:yes gene_type:complete